MTKNQYKNQHAKRLFSVLATLLCSTLLYAQTGSPAWNDYVARFQVLENKYRVQYEGKNYQQTEQVLKEMVALTDNLKLSDKERKDFEPAIKSANAIVHYNLACTYSLLGQKKQAVDEFGKAIEWGYTEYQHVKTDTDLDNIRREKKFIAQLNQIRQYDKLQILQNAGGYQKDHSDSLPEFKYQAVVNQNLKEVRGYFNLDSIAGKGDEVSKIINLMLFATRSIKYDGSNWALCEFDAIDFYNYYKTTGKGINCRHKAMTLNEMYLALGFKSRYVTCMPKDETDPDCHVINSVYSETLKKWLWMDASHGIYVMDENNNPLSIGEVRERLRNNLPLKLNKETERKKEWYLDYYMAKNLYWIQCTNMSRFNTESRYRGNDKDLQFIALIPVGYGTGNRYMKGNVVTHDPDYFWQDPGK